MAGRITEWHDDKGYGFVVANGGGIRVFVHVSEFARGSRRPVPGDLIYYVPAVDERGRTNARQIRHAGQVAAPERKPSRLPRTAIGITALSMAAIAWAVGILPTIIAAAYVGMSTLSWLVYWQDKQAAQRGTRRIAESGLHFADLLGGWPGALIAQQQFRHKTIKQEFQTVFWVTVIGNVAAVAWLAWSGKMAALSGLIGG